MLASQPLSQATGESLPRAGAQFGCAQYQQRGITRPALGYVFADVLQPDGSTQKLQTNYTYNAGGQPLYIDLYGEQGTPDDDRFFIEHQYANSTYPDLVTRADRRDTAWTPGRPRPTPMRQARGCWRARRAGFWRRAAR